jgi:threo-3-hydroxy-L-aspartate ammonia-lyase
VPVTLADVDAAAARLHDVAVRTPVVTSPELDARTGLTLFFKCEGLQHTGSFKFRGAYNKLATLSDDERAHGVVAASSGNHAQALAYAATRFGCRAVVVMPHDAPATKRDAARRMGAELVGYDRYRDDRDAIVHDLAARDGLTIVPSSNDAAVVAGQGTVLRELLADAGALDAVIVPVAGGGLLGGSAVVASAQSPAVRVVGVEPAASPDMRESLRTGALVRIDPKPSIADALLLDHPSELGYATSRTIVAPDDVVLVDDDELLAALRAVHEQVKVVVEPAGAAALAAVLAHRPPDLHGRVGVVLSGANVDVDRLTEYLTTQR